MVMCMPRNLEHAPQLGLERNKLIRVVARGMDVIHVQGVRCENCPIFAFAALGRSQHGGRGPNGRGGRGAHSMPTKCSACGNLDQNCRLARPMILRYCKTVHTLLVYVKVTSAYVVKITVTK
jgi:hypothetical protein